MEKKEKTIEERIKIASDFKNEGNVFFQAQQIVKALDKYHRAHLYVKGLISTGAKDAGANAFATQLAGGGGKPLTEEQKVELNNLTLAVHLNMAACHLKLSKVDRSIEDCNKALGIDPDNAKATFRRGQAYLQKRDTDRASEDLNRAAKLAPGDAAIQQALRKLKQEEKAQSDKQKRAFAGIFEKLSKEEEEEKKEVQSKEKEKEGHQEALKSEDVAPVDKPMEVEEKAGAGTEDTPATGTVAEPMAVDDTSAPIAEGGH